MNFLFPVLTFLYPSFNPTAGGIILQWRYILSLICSELWSGISFYWKTSKQQSQNMEDLYVVYTCWCRTISIKQSIMPWSSNQVYVYAQGRIDYFQHLMIWLYGARKSPSFKKPSSCWWKLQAQARWSLCLTLWLWSLLNNIYSREKMYALRNNIYLREYRFLILFLAGNFDRKIAWALR